MKIPGKKCLEHLRGMFAFAIYDEKEKTIFCARDRVGKKPFKYYLDDDVFIFASELKATVPIKIGKTTNVQELICPSL